ncbi:restriction endonuclease subunit S [Thermoactinomyces sp. CICC 10521]|nr:restriction endonuclease subunit S [Thermoactinomyces sp. CICC 10521]
MRLGDIAQFKTGLVLTRKKAEFEFHIKATYPTITLKNIDSDGFFNDEPFELFHSHEKLDQQYFTEPDDVLFRLNYPNTAVFIGEEHAGLLVPSMFAVIRISDQSVLPEFLAWYLNSEEVKNHLLRFQSGTMMPVTNKRTLEQIVIPELPLGKQKAIVELAKLIWKEKQLYQRLIREREQFMAAMTRQMMRDIQRRKER